MTTEELNRIAEQEGLPYVTEAEMERSMTEWEAAYQAGRKYGVAHGFVLGLGVGAVVMVAWAYYVVNCL